MKSRPGPSEADFGQDPGRFVRQDGPESQDLLIPRRGNAGIDPDNAAKLVFADLADDVTGKDFDAVQELHGVIASIDGLDHKADFVLVQIAGIVIKIITDSDCCRFLPDAERARYSSIFRPK